jgi:hypothetical protein
MPTLRVFSLIAGVASCVAGCAGAQSAFEQVQMCVGNERGVAELKRVMRSVAQSENLQLIDNSAQQAQNLKEVGADRPLKRDVSRAIDLHIEGESGLGVTAGNLGLPPYQVGLGFTEGRDPAKAHRLANHLISRLSQRWDVQRVPSSEGIFPMKGCGS